MLAIIIPYFKHSFFDTTLRSLAEQTDKRFKVYIGDDASSETPDELLNTYKNNINATYKKFETNLGSTSLVAHWSRCISMVQDEVWIMILGDDDVLEPNAIENWHKNYRNFEGRSNVIRFASQVIDGEGAMLSKKWTHPIFENAGGSYFRGFKYLSRSSLSEYVFYKPMFEKYGFQNYPLAWHSDDYAWLDFTEEMPIYSINESTVFIRVSSKSISGKSDNIELKNSATIQFLKDCLTNKILLFDRNQRLEFMLAFEIAIKKYRTLNFREWLFLNKLYVSNFKFLPSIKYVRRFIIGMFNL